MKVVILQLTDGIELLQELELNKLKQPSLFGAQLPSGLGEERLKSEITKEMHRAFNYHVCKWMQKHGLEVLK